MVAQVLESDYLNLTPASYHLSNWKSAYVAGDVTIEVFSVGFGT